MDVLLEDDFPPKAISDSLIEYFIVKPGIRLCDFLNYKEEDICRNEYNALNAIVVGRSALNVETSDMMKVKWMFFNWLVFTEEGFIVGDNGDTEDFPDTWLNDTLTVYPIKHTNKAFKVGFTNFGDHIAVQVVDTDDVSLRENRPVRAVPSFGLPVNEQKPDRIKYSAIVSSFARYFRPFMLYTAKGRNVKKRPYGSGSTCSIPDYPNDN